MPSKSEIEAVYAGFLWGLGLRLYTHGWDERVIELGWDDDGPKEIADEFLYVILGGITGYGEIDHDYYFYS